MFKRNKTTMVKRIVLTAAATFVALSTLGINNALAQQQELQIGYVEPQAILEQMPEMQSVQQRLQNFVQEKREEFAEQQTSFQERVAEFEEQASVMSDEARQQEEEELGQLQSELQQAQSQFQQEIQERQQELMGPLYEQINEAIDNVASEMGLTYVLNTATNQGDVIILYASEEAQEQYDITDEVMDELDM